MDVNELKQFIKDPTGPEDFQTIQNECEEILKAGDPYESQLLADYIGEILQTQSAKLQGNPQMYEAFQSYWHRLAFKAFINLPGTVKTDLLSRRILYAVSRGFNPDELLQKYFQIYNDKDVVKNIFVGFVKSLEDNSETLGSASLAVGDNKFLPQLKNWILDYTKFPSLNAHRTSIDRLNYVNQGPNVRSLTQPQRQALLKILKFYDDLLNPEPQTLTARTAAPLIDDTPAAPAAAAPVAPTQNFVRPAPTTPLPPPRSSPAAGSVRFAMLPENQNQPPRADSQIDINRKLDELKKRVE